MDHNAADTTLMDLSEYGLPNETERCPVTGLAITPGYVLDRDSADSAADDHAESREQADSNLQAMFDKFLYQK